MTSKTDKITIKLSKVMMSHYEHDTEEFSIPYDILEEYFVSYNDDRIARFWVTNNHADSIQLFVPMDLEYLMFILQEIKVRKFA